MEYKTPLLVALIILVIVIFVWKRRGSEKLTKRKGKKVAPQKKSKKAAPTQDAGEVDDEDDDDGDDDEPRTKNTPKASGNVAEDAKELYDLVHNELAGGMQIDAFEDIAGDLAGDEPSEVFIALKQKYTEAIDSNRDPLRSVTVKDYSEVLKKH